MKRLKWSGKHRASGADIEVEEDAFSWLVFSVCGSSFQQGINADDALSLAAFIIMWAAKQKKVPVEKVQIRVKRS